MISPLLRQAALTATLRRGFTPLGRRWLLFNARGDQIGRTRLTPGEGPALTRGLRQAGTLFGVSGLKRVEVLDADEQIVAEITAHNGRTEFVTELVDSDGQTIGGLQRRRGAGFRLKDAEGRDLAAVQRRTSGFALDDMIGRPLAELQAILALDARTLPRPDQMAGLPETRRVLNQQRAPTHHAFAQAIEISMVCDQLPLDEPLRTLVALSPVLLGMSY
jgi:hypothetical protein